MADDYVIRARIRIEDAGGPGAASVQGRLSRIESEGQRVSFSLGSMLQKAFLFAGGAGGLGMLAKGIIGLNAPLQEASYGMATLLSAQTGAPILAALGTAKGLIGDLKKDAAAGAGELANYTQGIQMILGPGLGAGASLQQIRELNRLAIGAGFALRGQEGLILAPMDIQQALTAGTGDRTTPIVNQALNAVGMSQAVFNKLDPAKRIEALTKAFQAFSGGVELMGKSWSAQMSTLQDKVKGLLTSVTAPLFERWSSQLMDVNGQLTLSADKMGEIANKWGGKLVTLWDHLIKQAGNYVAILGAAGLVSLAPTMLGAGRGLVSAGQGALAATGRAFERGAGSTFGAAIRDPFGMGRLATGAGTAGLLPGLASVGASAAGLAAAGVALTGLIAIAVGAFEGLRGVMTYYPEKIAALQAAFGRLGANIMNGIGALDMFATKNSSFVDIMGRMVDGLTSLVDALARAATFLDPLIRGISVIFDELWGGMKAWGSLLTGHPEDAANQMVANAARGQDYLASLFADKPGNYFDMQQSAADAQIPDGVSWSPADLAKKAAPVTNINGPVKFELKVEQNADPARVMSAFSEGVDRLSRFATQSRRVPVPMPG